MKELWNYRSRLKKETKKRGTETKVYVKKLLSRIVAHLNVELDIILRETETVASTRHSRMLTNIL